MRTNTLVGAACALLVIPSALLLTGVAAPPQDPRVGQYALARYEAVERLFARVEAQRLAGRGDGFALEDGVRWSQRRAEAAVAAGKLTAAAAWQAHVDYVQRAFEQLKVLFEAGRVDVQEHDKAAYHLADAKLRAATAGK